MFPRLSGLLSLFCAMAINAQMRPAPSPQPASLSEQDLAHGKQLFEAQCAPCHGITGTGGTGANLARPKLNHAADDTALFSVVQDGIANTGMPGAWQMTDREVWLAVAHVRSLESVAVEKLAGDPVKGQSIYEARGCSGCHIVSGIGGTLGPDLSEVGARRSAERLRQCLLQPGEALPDGFLIVRVVASDGSATEGIRANEDSFSIQLRDTSNKFHSFRKQQIRDLLAYLAGLRGKP